MSTDRRMFLRLAAPALLPGRAGRMLDLNFR